MRFLTFEYNQRIAIGVLAGQQLIDLSLADPTLPHEMKQLIAAGNTALERIRAILASPPEHCLVALDKVHFLPPILAPEKILCVGLNYMAHAAESAYKEPPALPVFFTRFASTLVAHQQPLIAPACSDKLDYEGELAVIIGKQARHITKNQALDYVFGYSIFHDGSVRDYQRRTPQWTLGKNFDASGGFGPYIVTKDELPAGAKNLHLETKLNGEVMQSASTSNMIFDVATLIEHLTEVMTLSPGDVIITGTPEGVGFARTPPRYLKAGDRVEISIEGIGTLENPVIEERAVA